MAKINITTLKPVSGTLRIKNPILASIIADFEFIEPVDEYDKTKLAHAEANVDVFDLPDGTKGPLELYLVGKNSQQWLDFMKKIKEMAKKGSGVDISTGKVDFDLMDRISDESREFMATLIVGWLDNGALDAPYSHEEALDLVSNPDNIWLLEQMQEFVLKESNFFLVA